MKNQKYSVAAGIILFILAALFSISLLSVAVDFGGISPARDTFFYSLGKMLTSVYGLTSVFIPLFLIVAGLQSFMSKWRIRNGVILLGSIIPFFTLDAIEHICRMLLASESDSVLMVKIGSTLLIGVLILAAEYLLLAILGDVIENSIKENFEYNKMEELLNTEEQEDEENDVIQFFGDKTDSEEIPETENKEEFIESNVDGESDEDITKDALFLQQKEILKDLIDDEPSSENTTSKSQNEDETVIEEPTIIEQDEFDDAEVIPESVDEEEILNDEDFAEPELPEELSPFDHIFDEQTHEDEIPEQSAESASESDEEPPQTDETVHEEVEAISAEPILDTIEQDAEEEAFEEPAIEETMPLQSEDFQNEFDEMADVEPVGIETEEDYVEDTVVKESGENNYEIPEEDEFDDISDDDFKETDYEIPEESEFNDINDDVFEETDEEIPEATDSDKTEINEEPFGVEDIFSQMEADAAAHPVIKEQDAIAVRDSAYQQEIEPPDIVSEKEIEQAQEKNNQQIESEPQMRKLSEYKIPTDLLEKFENDEYWRIDDETKAAGENLKKTLNEFGIEAEVTGIRKGPVVTMFELLPAPGVKLSKIVNLQDNIALALAAKSVRIVAPIPGKHAVGIEIPNKERAIVSFREIIEQPLPEYKKMAIPVILGKDISGQSQIIDIAKTPHLLIAGATGAGKSVCVNSIILSILYNRSPRDVKLIMVDPKVVELKLYNDIPHLLTPVVTEPKKALQVLQYCICEMERRYALLDGMGVRDIVSYNTRIRERNIATEKLPYIVVIIDEFADLMATSGKELETSVARLTAMSRAVGIHLVLATQRPSVNVITGLIKANIPSRIAFMVASRTDSNIIIDATGAEKLLGKGDMLYTSAVNPIPTRIQGTLVGDNEVERVVEYVKSYGGPEYIDDEIFIDDDEIEDDEPGLFSDGEDPLYDQALQIVIQAGKASASYIQRRLKIGYNRAARLVEEMEERGIVGPANGSKPREVIHAP